LEGTNTLTQNPRTALLHQAQGARRRNRVILHTVEPRSIDSFPSSPRGKTTKKSIGKQAHLVSGFCSFDPWQHILLSTGFDEGFGHDFEEGSG